jgi:hypothetical protein
MAPEQPNIATCVESGSSIVGDRQTAPARRDARDQFAAAAAATGPLSAPRARAAGMRQGRSGAALRRSVRLLPLIAIPNCSISGHFVCTKDDPICQFVDLLSYI